MNFRLATCGVLLGLVLVTANLHAQRNRPAANLEIRVYRVDDLLTPPKDYPFEGSRIPTTGQQGQAGWDPYQGGFGGLGGMGGGMGGGVGGGAMGGGGMFAIQSAVSKGSQRQQPSRGITGGAGTGAGAFGAAANGQGQAKQPPRRKSGNGPAAFGSTGIGGPGGATGAGGLGSAAGGLGLGSAGFGSRMPGAAKTPRFTVEELIGAITTVVAPESWDQVGGPASCVKLGGMLVISQTQDAHKMIDALLKQIRSQGGALSTVTLTAYWLSVDSNELNQLLVSNSKTQIDTKRLAQHSQKGFHASISCFSGQTVHVVAGERRQIKASAVPVVGDDVAYSVQTLVPNLGVLLQATPLVLGDDNQAIIDIQSSVTQATKSESKKAASTIPIDQVHMNANQLATTVKISMGQPFLVGGLSNGKDSDDDRIKRT